MYLFVVIPPQQRVVVSKHELFQCGFTVLNPFKTLITNKNFIFENNEYFIGLKYFIKVPKNTFLFSFIMKLNYNIIVF